MKLSDLFHDMILFKKVYIDIHRAFEIWAFIEMEKEILEQKEVA